MDYLVDTNVLIRFIRRGEPFRKLWAAGHALGTSPQNYSEFWNVLTRPAAQNGFGLSTAGADRRLRRLEQRFTLFPDSPAVFPHWRRLVVAYGVSGVKVHDARLVAFMLAYRISRILTLNTADFARYASEGIVAVDPRTV